VSTLSTQKLNAVTALSARHRRKRAIVCRNFRKRNLRRDRLHPAARIVNPQRTTTTVRQITVHIAYIRYRNCNFYFDDGFPGFSMICQCLRILFDYLCIKIIKHFFDFDTLTQILHVIVNVLVANIVQKKVFPRLILVDSGTYRLPFIFLLLK